MLTCQISSQSVYSVALGWQKTPNFVVFWNSLFCNVTNWQQTEKVERGWITTNFPLSNGIKNRFYNLMVSSRNRAQYLCRSKA